MNRAAIVVITILLGLMIAVSIATSIAGMDAEPDCVTCSDGGRP